MVNITEFLNDDIIRNLDYEMRKVLLKLGNNENTIIKYNARSHRMLRTSVRKLRVQNKEQIIKQMINNDIINDKVIPYNKQHSDTKLTKINVDKYMDNNTKVWLPMEYLYKDELVSNYNIDYTNKFLTILTSKKYNEPFKYVCSCGTIVKDIASIDPGTNPIFTVYTHNKIILPGGNGKHLLFSVDKYMELFRAKKRAYEFENIKYRSTTQYKNDIITFNSNLSKISNVRKEVIKKIYKELIHYLNSNDIKIVLFGSLQQISIEDSIVSYGRLVNSPHTDILKDLLSSNFNTKGKDFIMVNESYTTKTSFITGKVITRPSTKEMFHGGALVNSDINGARNILLKYISNS